MLPLGQLKLGGYPSSDVSLSLASEKMVPALDEGLHIPTNMSTNTGIGARIVGRINHTVIQASTARCARQRDLHIRHLSLAR